MISEFLFDGWTPLIRILWVGPLAYLCLVAFLRISGKRTLARMNAFDLVVTVSLGSTLATILLSSNVSIAAGATALAVLIGLQYLVASLSVRLRVFRELVKSEPRLLLHRGRMLEDIMLDERVSEDEILAAIRSQGRSELAEVDAVILETDGSFSVVTSGGPAVDALRVVRGYPRTPKS